MGDGNNRTLSLLVTNGTYLYVGFDNPTTGVEIWRTNTANPIVTADFSQIGVDGLGDCLLYTSPSPRDRTRSRMPSSA